MSAADIPSAIGSPLATDDSYAGHGTLVFTCFFLAVQVAFVALRYVVKWQIQRSIWGFDDVLIGLSLIGQIGLAAITIDALINSGVGYHMAYIEANFPWKLERWFKELFATAVIYNFTSILPKIAILIFYRRVFGNANGGKPRWSITILMGVLIAYFFVLLVIVLIACRPIAANWDQTIPGARCMNKQLINTYITIPNQVTDIWMIILPLPIIWKLQVQKRLKMGLTLTFFVGIIGLGASLGRLVTSLGTNSSSDITWIAGREILMWLQLEPGCYLITACLPSLRSLLDRVVTSTVFRSSKKTASGMLTTRSWGWTVADDGTNSKPQASRNRHNFERLEKGKDNGMTVGYVGVAGIGRTADIEMGQFNKSQER